MTTFINGKPWGLKAVAVTMAQKGAICSDHGLMKKAGTLGLYKDGSLRCVDCSLKWWNEHKTHKNPIITNCPACSAPIVWGLTSKYIVIAIDWPSNSHGLIEIIDDDGAPIMIEHGSPNHDEIRFTDHAMTCPYVIK